MTTETPMMRTGTAQLDYYLLRPVDAAGTRYHGLIPTAFDRLS